MKVLAWLTAVLVLVALAGSGPAVTSSAVAGLWGSDVVVASQSVPRTPDWNHFFGYWRLDPETDIGPMEPFRLQITVVGDELRIERHGFSITEVSRYRLDGASSKTVQNGRAVEASAAIEPTGLVIRTRMPLPDGRMSSVTEVYSVLWRLIPILTIERTTVVGTRTTVRTDLLRRLPTPRVLHPDNQPPY